MILTAKVNNLYLYIDNSIKKNSYYVDLVGKLYSKINSIFLFKIIYVYTNKTLLFYFIFYCVILRRIN